MSTLEHTIATIKATNVSPSKTWGTSYGGEEEETRELIQLLLQLVTNLSDGEPSNLPTAQVELFVVHKKTLQPSSGAHPAASV